MVVQLLVPAEAAGILFTANPVTGQRDQAMISAAWGLGEAVVGGLVTPDTLTVDKASGAVLARETADKQVMTVRVNGGTEEQPVPEELRRAPVLDDEAAAELVRLGVQIEELYGMPMDIEWALADGAFAIVQARPITALPGGTGSARAELPTEWPMPDPKGPYMRGSIADLMPDPLTPLFATMGVPAINAGDAADDARSRSAASPAPAGRLFDHDQRLCLSCTCSLGCRDWLWVLSRMVPALPRLLAQRRAALARGRAPPLRRGRGPLARAGRRRS